MKPVFTAQQMRDTEKRYFEAGNASYELMEKAASALTEEIVKTLPQGKITCVFACGSGGNGGDGYAAARMFSQRGGRAIVLKVDEPKNEDAKKNLYKAEKTAFAVIGMDELEKLPRPDMWADCIFGTGLTREVSGNALRVIERMNADRKAGTLILSCDIPSGLSSDTGRIMGLSVYADKTVTFQTLKRGHLIGKGLEVCGNTVVKDIGITQEFMPKEYCFHIEDADVKGVLPQRKRCAHKNNFGHLLIVAGSKGMAGAAAMCCMAALRSGTGLVTVACPESVVDIIQVLAPSAMCIPLHEKDGAMDASAAIQIAEALKGKSACAIGPGLSRRAHPACIEAVLDSGIPTVIDADALNIISENEMLRPKLNALHALTPHPGEAARLTGVTGADEFTYAEDISKSGCGVLVKGASSVILGKQLYVSSSGCVGMAKGGSGDALTGITGALLAQGLDCETALWCASQIHGRAGEIAQTKRGSISMLPTDLIDCISDWYNENT